ncbi:MAG: DUF4468 domain-containing protein [Flavobacteriales bacterium]|nr:MAG: DUF4468 domain-containing protein [Flavobacteriales bacterium]
MKKIKFYLLFYFTCASLFSQKIDGNKISEVYEVRGVDAKQIFSKLNYAIALIYEDAADVIKFKDDQSKLLVIKALALVPVLDAYKLMNPNNSALTDYIDYSHNYTLIIEARDEKYRIQMIYQDGKYSDSQLTQYKLPFSSKMDYDMADLEEIMEKAREEMNQDYYDMTSRKKKEIYILSQPKVVREYQQTLKEYSTLFFQSIYKKVLEDMKQEDW